MKSVNYVLIATLAVSLFSLPAQAAGDNVGTDTDCMEYAVPNVALTVNAGNIIFCVRYPHVGVPYSNSAFNVGATLSGPVITAVGGSTTTITITPGSGCTAGSPTTRSGLAALGVATTTNTVMTMTGPVCTGRMRGITTLTAGTVISDQEMPFTVYAQDTIKNSVEIGCGEDSTYQITTAPAIITDCADTATSREIDEWRSDMCDNPAGHGHCELHLHGGIDVDSTITGELDIHQDEACGATIPCLLEGDIGFSGSFNITQNGNTTIMPPFSGTEEFQQALWLFIFWLFLIVMAENKKDMIYHLMVVVLGFVVIVVVPGVLGIPRLVIAAVIVYQFFRIYKLSESNRNSFQKNETGDV